MNDLNDLELEGINSDEGKEEYELPLRNSTEQFGSTGSTLVKTQESNFFLKQQSALPSYATHCTFEWKNINVYVGNGKDKKSKQILHNLNGTIQSGELLAVMGGSGAGKSTLLNALSGRTNLNQQSVNGYLAINQKKFQCSNQKIIKSLCTFVPQSDELCPTQTVQEALLFYAKLKLPHYSAEKQEKRINYLIDVLHLNKCRYNYIGSESKRGISGGEKRRVSIAAEILNDKDIIYLDEPTSGLDAYTAARTIKTLKQFCVVSNKIIIATIHQPSIEVFYLFEKLILLSNGKCCFNSFIHDIDIFFKNQLRPKTNPADVIVFEVQKNADKYDKKWNQSKLNRYTNRPQIDYEWNKYDDFDLNDPKNSIKTSSKSASKTVQYALLIKRELKALIRNKRVTIVRLLQVIFFGLTSGLCYWNIAESFMERTRAFFLLTIMPLLFGIVCLLTAFPAQKLLFVREYNSGTYNITPWALSFMMIEIPREVIHMFIFTIIVIFMIDLDGNIFQYWFTFFLTSIAGGSFGIFFGTICKTTVEAAQTVPAALIPLLIFSDGLIPLKSLPDIIRWIGTINPLYYLIRCFYIIEFYGAVYPRKIDDDMRQICDSYETYVNVTSNRVYLDNYNTTNINSNSTIQEICNQSIYNSNDFEKRIQQINQSISEFNFNSTDTKATDYLDNIKADYNWNISTTLSEEQQKVDQYCSDEIPWQYFFKIKDLNKNALVQYWLTIILICVILRIISVLLLLAMNNNVFSWICNQINKIIKCQCISFKFINWRKRFQTDSNDKTEDKTDNCENEESDTFVV